MVGFLVRRLFEHLFSFYFKQHILLNGFLRVAMFARSVVAQKRLKDSLLR